ncbi:MAG TPA: hypothetical protein P5136_00455, partial [Methanofastidiosum sp.]|nr:hypothetical protein [Methanofastidiosum sp.]
MSSELKVNTISPNTTEMISTSITGAVPIGSVVAYLPGYFINGSNSTYNAVAMTLPTGWKVCDGSAVNDAESPIWVGAGRYLPNLTDSRFLMGSSSRGSIGGATSNTLSVSHIPQHSHTINHDHPSTTSGTESANHTHFSPICAYTVGAEYVSDWTTIGATASGTNKASGKSTSNYTRLFYYTNWESATHTHST